MQKIKVLSIFGTRPEAIKMAPVIKKLANDPRFLSKIVVTGQHREMLEQTLGAFQLTPDYDLAIMRENQTLTSITSRIQKVSKVFFNQKNQTWCWFMAIQRRHSQLGWQLSINKS